jgi:hypothetical protein
MSMYPQAYTVESLVEIIEANDSVETPTNAEIERLLDLADTRAASRGETNALDESQTDCLIGTDWTSFAQDEFGYSGGKCNVWAFGVYESEISSGKGADLFSDTHVVQQGWLESGDGRMASLEAYMDDEYDNASEGELWIPSGAQQYICIIELGDELLHDDAAVADAM